jgi:hypothetical protein
MTSPCLALPYAIIRIHIHTHTLAHDALLPHFITINGTGVVINGNSTLGPAVDYNVRTNATTFNGTGIANSALMISPAAAAGYGLPSGMASNFTLTFTAAGTYRYKCQLHDTIGMIGYVLVT